MTVVVSIDVKELYSQSAFEDIVQAYGKAAGYDGYTEWDFYYYAASLWKTKRYKEGREVGRQGILAFRDFELIRMPYCWCLYYLYIQGYGKTKHDEDSFYRAANSIISYSVRTVPYYPLRATVFKVCEALKSKNSIDYAAIDSYISVLTPEELSDAPRTLRNAKGTVREFESEREKWYAYKTKTLFELGRYDECYALCDKALQSFSQLHHDNDIWFQYRMADSLCALGRYDEAKALAKKALQHMQNWNLYRVLFDVAVAEEKTDDAIVYGASVMVAPGELAMKVAFLTKLGCYLAAHGREDDAYRHLLLARTVRAQKQWRLSPQLEEALQALGERELPPHWEEAMPKQWIAMKHGDEIPHYGTITRLMPGNKAGFIDDYYFSRQELHDVPMKVGEAVSFYVAYRWNKKKNQLARQAVDITAQVQE